MTEEEAYAEFELWGEAKVRGKLDSGEFNPKLGEYWPLAVRWLRLKDSERQASSSALMERQALAAERANTIAERANTRATISVTIAAISAILATVAISISIKALL